jgi:hypothetical protein
VKQNIFLNSLSDWAACIYVFGYAQVDKRSTVYRTRPHLLSFQASSSPHLSRPSAVMMLIQMPRPASRSVQSESGLFDRGRFGRLSGFRGRAGALRGL